MSERVLTTLAEKVDPAHSALLLVDFQNDFCSAGGAYGRPEVDFTAIERAVTRAGEALSAARAAGVPVIFVRAIYDEVYQAGPMREVIARRGAPPLCQSGTWGAEFYRLAPCKGEFIVTKHRYSAFAGTDLEPILHSLGVRTLVVAGVTTHVCVESTVRDAFLHDYYAVALADCVAARDDASHQAALATMDAYFGEVVPAIAVIALWEAARQKGPIASAVTTSPK